MSVSSTPRLLPNVETISRPRRSGARSFRSAVRWLVLDAVFINLAFFGSYLLRYQLSVGGAVLPQNETPFLSYGWIDLAYTVTMLTALSVDGVYRNHRSAGLLDQWGAIFRSALAAGAIIAALVFMLRPYAYSRGIFVYVGVASTLILSLVRLAAVAIRHQRYRSGHGVTNVLVVGGTHIAKMMMQRIVGEPGLGYRVVGFVDDGEPNRPPADFGRFRMLGRTGDLERVLREQQIDQVLVALPATAHPQILDTMQRCRDAGADFAMVPDLLEMRLSQLDMATIGGIPVIGLRESSLQGFNRLFKRAIDMVIATAVLLVGSPLLALAALAVKFDSPGPIFFGQVRVGKDGELFTAWKFRSMKVNAEAELERLRQQSSSNNQVTFKLKDDPRCTRVGTWLRRASFDELPQCWNVLRGEMSVVGPRPPVPREVQRYQEWQKARLQVAPGMTGLWQVSGRSSLDFDEMVMLDLYYIENWSPGLELKILLLTIPAVITARGAY